MVTAEDTSLWPALPLSQWQETRDTLHMWLQIVGKVKLELCPFLNEWWNITLQLTPRGLTTSTIPSGDLVFAVDFDFIEHNLFIRASNGAGKALPLMPRTVASFYREFMDALNALGIEVAINTLPAEVADPIRCDVDEVHASYDAEYVNRWWRILVQTEKVMQRFRTPFVGKSSPVHFFWGTFDLNHTRFSGRPATPPSSWPRFQRIAEDQENFACGFWPGSGALQEPAFFAYTFPEPAGSREAGIRPSAGYFDDELGEFILRYDDVRGSAAPEQAILDFFKSAYEVGAALGDWDRTALEQR